MVDVLFAVRVVENRVVCQGLTVASPAVNGYELDIATVLSLDDCGHSLSAAAIGNDQILITQNECWALGGRCFLGLGGLCGRGV